jgi:hypothetical protein
VVELACPLHHPMACGHLTREHSFLSGAALSHHTTVGGGTFLRGVKHLGLDF